jgi:hypothetical protein
VRVALRFGGAAVCLAAAVVLVLLAVDAHAWSSRFAADDLRYRHDASEPGLWHVHDLSPFGLDRSVLGIADDITYRRALRDFRLARATELLGGRQEMTNRVAALIDLTGAVQSRLDPVRRSQLENLLGVLGFGLSSQDIGQRTTFFNNGISALRAAIVLDPANNNAFFNLDYALHQLTGHSQLEAPGNAPFGGSGGAGYKQPGHGY